MENKKDQGKLSYEKGIELEKKFSEYVKNELEYTHIIIRHNIKQFYNDSGVNVDIIGQRLNARGRKLYKYGMILLIMVGISIIGAIIYAYVTNWVDYTPVAFISCAGWLELIAFISFMLSKKYNIENIWVECKNWKNEIDIDVVSLMISKISDYKKTKDKRYKFKEFVIVSANGFKKTAIQKAEDHNIQCFSIDNVGNFQKINKWQ
jgi:hypothetical protein